MNTLTPLRPASSGPDGDRSPSAWDRVRSYSPPSQYLPVLATFALFIGMFGLGGARYDGFTDPQVFLSLLLDNSFLIVLAVGMTFVILTGGIDLSVGSNVALSTIIAAKTLEMGWSPYLSIVTVLAVGTLLGLSMGLLIHYFDIQPFIATLAGMFLARGLCYLISVESIPITDDRVSEWAFAVVNLPLSPAVGGPVLVALLAVAFVAFRLVGDPGIGWTALALAGITAWATFLLADGYYVGYTSLVAVATVLVGAFVLARTRFGRTVYAIGGNESSAMLMGLRVAFTKVGVYAISGFCAAFGGLLFAMYTLSGYSLNAVGMELDAIAAVVIGGTLLTGGRGFVVGSFIGVLVLGTIQTFISFDGTLSSWWTRITIGLLVLVFVIAQRVMTRRQP